MGKKRRRVRGHFCWCCGGMLPNEKFSGKGHARHLCKDCSKLGKEELEFRQGIRNIDRLVYFDSIPRKHRKSFEKFFSHPNPRIRQYANEIAAWIEEERRKRREEWLAIEAEEAAFEAAYEEFLEDDVDIKQLPTSAPSQIDEEEIPF